MVSRDHELLPTSGSQDIALPAGVPPSIEYGGGPPSPPDGIVQLYAGKSPAEASEAVAAAKAALERVLGDDPDNYAALAALGELDLRVGLVREAQALLYRASLLRPPSWEAFQRTSLLLRRAEQDAHAAFDRTTGAPPPAPVRAAAAYMWRALHVGLAHVARGI